MISRAPRVLVTRAAEDSGPLSHALGELGFQPVEAPAVHRVWDIDRIAELARLTPRADWVVVTSGAVADVIATAAPAGWPNARYAAVGPSTAARLEGLGFPVSAVPTRSTAAHLIEALGDLGGQHVVWPHGDLAPDGTLQALAQRGAHVAHAVAYRNLEPQTFRERLLDALPVQATTLLSGSAARRVASHVPIDERGRLGKIVVIGPSTRAVCEEIGLEVHGMADPHSISGLLAAVRATLTLSGP